MDKHILKLGHRVSQTLFQVLILVLHVAICGLKLLHAFLLLLIFFNYSRINRLDSDQAGHFV